MRKNQILAILCLVSLVLCSCDNELLDDVETTEATTEETYLPAHIEEYGKAIAAELNSAVKNLSKMGVDYSSADRSEAFKEQFFEDYYEACPTKTKSKSVNPMLMSREGFEKGVKNLTKIQHEFIAKILLECKKSESYPDLAKRLISINKDIHSDVPEIQQERLFTITAVLYYGMNEFQNLEKLGLMPKTPRSDMQYLRLKTGGIEEGGGSFGDSCRKFLATTWIIAIAEPTPFGEVVASVVTVVVGGVLLYEVIVCAVETIDCGIMYAGCVDSGSMPSWKCWDCFTYCQGQNVWDCPRPY